MKYIITKKEIATRTINGHNFRSAHSVRYKVFSEAKIHIVVFCVSTLYYSGSGDYQHSEEHPSSGLKSMKMEAVCPSEMLVPNCQGRAACHSSEDHIFSPSSDILILKKL
jgi:hypothetical protein